MRVSRKRWLPQSWRSRAPREIPGPGSRAGIGASRDNDGRGPRLPGMTSWSRFEPQPKSIEDLWNYLAQVSKQWDDALVRLQRFVED